MKVLNLYAGIGGNRKLWQNVEVTAVENNEKIAKIYADYFPNDNIIVADAHKFLRDNFEKYDFIWTSPPCPTHSRAANWGTYAKTGEMLYRPKYPSMILYEEILFLKHYFKGNYCVENVISYYKPLIAPIEAGGHYFWTNYYVKPISQFSNVHHGGLEALQKHKGFDLSGYKGIDKVLALRNCVLPKLGEYIFNSALENLPPIQEGLFGTDS